MARNLICKGAQDGVWFCRWGKLTEYGDTRYKACKQLLSLRLQLSNCMSLCSPFTCEANVEFYKQTQRSTPENRNENLNLLGYFTKTSEWLTTTKTMTTTTRFPASDILVLKTSIIMGSAC